MKIADYHLLQKVAEDLHRILGESAGSTAHMPVNNCLDEARTQLNTAITILSNSDFAPVTPQQLLAQAQEFIRGAASPDWLQELEKLERSNETLYWIVQGMRGPK